MANNHARTQKCKHTHTNTHTHTRTHTHTFTHKRTHTPTQTHTNTHTHTHKTATLLMRAIWNKRRNTVLGTYALKKVRQKWKMKHPLMSLTTNTRLACTTNHVTTQQTPHHCSPKKRNTNTEERERFCCCVSARQNEITQLIFRVSLLLALFLLPPYVLLMMA